MKFTAILATLGLSATLAVAQGNLFNFHQQDSSFVGITNGQTATLNVLFPTIPAPVAQIICSATLNIFDDQGNLLKTQDFTLIPGRPVSISLNADTDLPVGTSRTQIRAHLLSPGVSSGGGGACDPVTALDIFDNSTGKTTSHVEMRITYPKS